MKLLPKASLIISISLLAVLTLFYFFMNRMLLRNYSELESSEVKRNLERVFDAMEYELKIIYDKLGDWAFWNETYQFLQDENQEYIENNLSNDELNTLHINFMLFYNKDKQIVITKKYPETTDWQPNGLMKFLKDNPAMLNHTSPESGWRGLLILSDTLLLLASRPVLQNDKTGPAVGTLLFGKFFDKVLGMEIAKRLQLDVQFYLSEKTPQAVTRMISRSDRGKAIVVPEHENLVDGFIWIQDIHQKPALLIHLKSARPIYQQGLQLINSFVIGLTASGMLFLVICLLLIRHAVLSPLFRLVNDVQTITRSSDVTRRVQEMGRDELTTLSSEINTMLISLEDKSQALVFEKEKSEALLHNILPVSIAQRMRQGETMIAERFDNVTILFSDIVGFTQMATHSNPVELVELLNRIFSEFDQIADRHGLEKIKTIGDAYMVVAGVPTPCEQHTEAMALMALEMRNSILALNELFHTNISIRIGISTGEVVAGIIGKRKFAYDLWGDVVNTAARMESHGVPGKVHCTEMIYQQLKHRFEFEERGLLEIKGKGLMRTYFLLGVYQKEDVGVSI